MEEFLYKLANKKHELYNSLHIFTGNGSKSKRDHMRFNSLIEVIELLSEDEFKLFEKIERRYF